MKSTEFIISLLKYLQKIWADNSKLRIKYAYDKTTNFHIIEIDSELDKYKKMTYVYWCTYMYKCFDKCFPNEDILISEPDPCNDMSSVLYEYNKLNR